jgi:hypothetical protein
MTITDNQLFLLIKTARPKQWLKNLAVYASLVFSGFFFFKPTIGHSYFLFSKLRFYYFLYINQ